MALTLEQAEDDVREQTAHRDDIVRLDETQLRRHLNREYRKLRSWLIDVAPQLYIVTSGDISLPDVDTGQEVHLSSDAFAFEKIHRVDQLDDDGKWREVEMAHPSAYNDHQTGGVTWREEGGCLIFGPDDEVEGTFRVLFHATPAVLTTVDATFKIPHQLEDALIWRACMKVSVADGDSYKEFRELADKELADAEPMLRKRYGVHVQRAGLRHVLPY